MILKSVVDHCIEVLAFSALDCDLNVEIWHFAVPLLSEIREKVLSLRDPQTDRKNEVSLRVGNCTDEETCVPLLSV